MRASKLTSKFQATIPKEIRKALKLQAGDAIVFSIGTDGLVVIKKLQPLDKAYLEALNHTLTEWDSNHDDEAFANLQDI